MSLPTAIVSFLHTNRCAKSTGWKRGREEKRLTALGDAALDVLELDVVGVVGLDIGGETVQSALDGFLGGRVHHAGLLKYQRIFLLQLLFCDIRIVAHHLVSS